MHTSAEVLVPAWIAVCGQVHALEQDEIPYSNVQMNLSVVYLGFQHAHTVMIRFGKF